MRDHREVGVRHPGIPVDIRADAHLDIRPGEFLTLVGAFKANTWVAFLATTGIILSAGYALWLYRRIIFGKLEKASLRFISDLSWREIAVMTPLVLLTILFGFYPAPILDASSVSVEALIKGFNASLAAADQARLALVP